MEVSHAQHLVFSFFALVLGLLIGSFLNVCIYRLPIKKTIVKGRSYCPACGHDLNACDLIPVISFLMLRRKCRYCRKPIAWRYPLVELWCGLFTALAWGLGYDQTQMLRTSIMSLKSSVHLEWGGRVLIIFFFYTLVVWALILKDGKKPPQLFYLWLAIPALLIFTLYREQSILLIILAVATFLLHATISLLLKRSLEELPAEWIGLSAMALVSGYVTLLILLSIYLSFALLYLLATTGALPTFRLVKTQKQFIRGIPLTAAFFHSIIWLMPII